MTDLATRPQELASAPAQRTTQASADTAQFLDDLFSGQAGLLCLGYIDGDPRIEGIDGKRQEWYAWPRQRSDATQWLNAHNDQGHNTYVRQCLFTKKSGKIAHALPSTLIWQDEAKADTPASILIETSPGNYQAYIRLDRPATVSERSLLMTAWRDARPHTDDCSADPVHFVRVPGGHNTKRHGDFTVRYAVRSERVYPADRLLARCRPEEGKHTSCSSCPETTPAALDKKQLDYWLDHVEDLLNADKTLPRAFVNAGAVSRIILEKRARGEAHLLHESGSPDTSRERLWLANGLIMARYSDEQTAALLWYFEHPDTVRIKGKNAVWADIPRVIALAHQAHPQITPRSPVRTKRDGIESPVASPFGVVKPNRPRGRPTHAPEVDRFFLYLREKITSADPVKIGDLARDYGRHRRTISTYLHDLAAKKRITLRRAGQYGGLVITFPDVIENSTAFAAKNAPVLAIETPETPIAADAAHEETEYQEEKESVYPMCAAADHISDAPAPPLAGAIWQALAALPRQRVNEKTGEVVRWPVTDRRVSGWIAETYPDLWRKWDRNIPAMVDRVRYQQRNARFAELDDLSPGDLDRQITATASTIARFEARAATVDDERRAYYQGEANRRRGRLMMLLTTQQRRDQREAWAGAMPLDRAELYASADAKLAEIRDLRAAGRKRRFVMPEEALPL